MNAYAQHCKLALYTADDPNKCRLDGTDEYEYDILWIFYEFNKGILAGLTKLSQLNLADLKHVHCTA